MNNKKDMIKAFATVAGIVFLAIFIVGFLPRGIAFLFEECGYPISSKNLVTKYSMGIGIRIIGLIFFFIIMKKFHILEWYHCRFDKNSLKLSWLFIVYIILNVETVPLKNLHLLPVILMIIEAFMIGLYEETIFRGLVLPIFLKRWGKSRKQVISSVFTSSIMFGLMHLINLSWNPNIADVITQVCYASIMGIAFSALLLRTNGNLIWCSLLHGCYDIASGFGDFAEKAASGAQVSEAVTNILPYVLNLAYFIPLLLYGCFLLRKVETVTEDGKIYQYELSES